MHRQDWGKNSFLEVVSCTHKIRVRFLSNSSVNPHIQFVTEMVRSLAKFNLVLAVVVSADPEECLWIKMPSYCQHSASTVSTRCSLNRGYERSEYKKLLKVVHVMHILQMHIFLIKRPSNITDFFSCCALIKQCNFIFVGRNQCHLETPSLFKVI